MGTLWWMRFSLVSNCNAFVWPVVVDMVDWEGNRIRLMLCARLMWWWCIVSLIDVGALYLIPFVLSNVGHWTEDLPLCDYRREGSNWIVEIEARVWRGYFHTLFYGFYNYDFWSQWQIRGMEADTISCRTGKSVPPTAGHFISLKRHELKFHFTQMQKITPRLKKKQFESNFKLFVLSITSKPMKISPNGQVNIWLDTELLKNPWGYSCKCLKHLIFIHS